MPNRAMKSLTVILGGILAGFALTANPATAAPAKDCLTAPGATPAQGEHWYYRIDHATKRNCWYVRAEGQSAAQPAATLTNSAAAPASSELQPSVADARAEIPAAAEAPQPNNTNASSAASGATIANNDSAQGIAQAGPPPSNAQSRTLAERRSDHPNANNPTAAAPSNAVAGTQPQARSASQVGEPETYPVWMLMSALLGVLALVGLATVVIAHVRRGPVISRYDERDRKQTSWGAEPFDDGVASAPSDDEPPMNWIRIARENQAKREASRRADQIERLLSRASRRSAV